LKLSDYVIEYLQSTLGIRHIFMIVGGANMHLTDSVARNPKMTYVCVQHEQAAAMAAEGYARVKNGMGAALVTSGPGGTNALTGVCGAWMDSIPCLFLSGQVSVKDYTDGKTIRQLGVQQINIVEIVKSVTKYAAIVIEPATIRYHLERAAYSAREGRPGPVWLDIPQNVQMVAIDPQALQPWIPEELPTLARRFVDQIPDIIGLVRRARRPILIIGNGIRLAKAEVLLWQLIEQVRFPIITTWSGADLIPEDHPLYVGRSGVFGQYGANFAVANADLIFSLGSRLDTRQTGTSRKTFARAAKKIVVDISPHELQKDLTDIDVPVHADCREFLDQLVPALDRFAGQGISPWTQRCQEWKRRYPATIPAYYEEKDYVNSYVFVDVLCDELTRDDVIVTDMGTSLTCTHQAFKVKQGQRLFTNTGLAPMGYGLPAAIGAWFSSGRDRVICIVGDGGLQLNIQELQTIVQYKIPLKLFVMNNNGYLTIKHTQNTYFGGRITAADPGSGYSTPNTVRVAQAYGIATQVIETHKHLKDRIRAVLATPGAVVCDVKMAPDQPLVPILLQHKRADGTIATDPIERLSPYLPEDEFRANMIVPVLED